MSAVNRASKHPEDEPFVLNERDYPAVVGRELEDQAGACVPDGVNKICFSCSKRFIGMYL